VTPSLAPNQAIHQFDEAENPMHASRTASTGCFKSHFANRLFKKSAQNAAGARFFMRSIAIGGVSA
jgi:hypothetical protein